MAKKLKKRTPNSILIKPPEEGGITFEYVEGAERSEGTLWYVKPKHQFMYLFIERRGRIEPYIPSDTIEELPERLYRALYGIKQPLQRMFTIKRKFIEKLQLGMGIAALGLLALLIIIVMDMV